MKKKALIVLGGLALLVGGAGFGGHAWIKARLQKESLVAQMERAWNLRAHLDETSVSLFSSPATVKLIGLKLAPRDEEADKPFASRAAMVDGAALVRANEVVLSIELRDLLGGTLHVDRLHIDGADVRNVVENGYGPLYAMFKRPGEVAPAPAEAAISGGGGGNVEPVPAPVEAAPATEPVAVSGEEQAAKPKKEPKPSKAAMQADQLRVNLAAKSVGISNCRYEYTDLTGQTKATVEDVNFAVTDIDVVPGDLANHNLANFNLSAALRFEKTDEKLVLADCGVESVGTVRPFDPKTGDMRPDTDMTVKVRKGGLLGGMPFEKHMSKKDLEKLAKNGIHLGDIAMGGVLSQDAGTRVHVLPGGKMIFKDVTTFAFPQYEISVEPQSWISPAQDLHNLKAKIVVSAELSAKIIEDAKKTFEAQQKAEDATGIEAWVAAGKAMITDMVASGLMDEQKRLVLPYQAKGKLSKPKVDIVGIASEASGGLLKGSGGILNKVLDELFPTKEEGKEGPKEQK